MSERQPAYQFVGISPYVERAAEALGLSDGRLKGKSKAIEHLARIQTALGQAATARAEDRGAIFEHALAYRGSLAVALLAAEFAIDDVAAAMSIPCPSFADLDLEIAAAHRSVGGA